LTLFHAIDSKKGHGKLMTRPKDVVSDTKQKKISKKAGELVDDVISKPVVDTH
jgi:hypothetical protein